VRCFQQIPLVAVVYAADTIQRRNPGLPRAVHGSLMAFGFIKKAFTRTAEAAKASVEKLKGGLTKTRDAFVGGLRSLLRGRKLDQALLDELEQRLITSDLGVTATRKIMDDLNGAWREGKIRSGDEVLDFLKAEMKSYWPPESRELRLAEKG